MVRSFKEELRRVWAVAPTTSHGVAAMGSERRASLLAGHDATTVLEAASTVLADIENKRSEAVAARLPANDRRVLEQWHRQVNGAPNTAPTPVHPLALLAATTLALGQAGPASRSDEARDELSRRLTQALLDVPGLIRGRAGESHGVAS